MGFVRPIFPVILYAGLNYDKLLGHGQIKSSC